MSEDERNEKLAGDLGEAGFTPEWDDEKPWPEPQPDPDRERSHAPIERE